MCYTEDAIKFVRTKHGHLHKNRRKPVRTKQQQHTRYVAACRFFVALHICLRAYVPVSYTHLGSVFLGAYTPEPLGDYFAGTNHVLPLSLIHIFPLTTAGISSP